MNDQAPGQELTIDRRAPTRRIELDEQSWVDLVDGFVVDPDAQFALVDAAASWQQNEVLRYDRYVPEQRLSAMIRPDALAVFRQIGLHLQATYRVPFVGPGVLKYRDGTDFQGLHSDREMRWLDDTLIAIVVLGARRPFVLRKRAAGAPPIDRTPAGAGAGDVVLLPGCGDLLVMGGAAQRDWLHGVPAADADAARLSLTWRWTSKRGRPDTNPGYYEGRQYADGPRRPGYRSRRA
ncbi:MAG: alpha-ketoglutarate-dependent dioxygenase AlkB [Acidimicrobiales bacterium]|nr:alpha-ketoglutarate-dependent dioxygenase AlkB [Acidimicrobiales bacterium]